MARRTMKSLEDSLDRFPNDFMNERNQSPLQECDFVGAGLALPGSEQGCEQVMAGAEKKCAASGAPTLGDIIRASKGA